MSDNKGIGEASIAIMMALVLFSIFLGGASLYLALPIESGVNPIVDEQDPVDTYNGNTTVAEQALDSVVAVQVKTNGQSSSQGTGFVYQTSSGQKYIITNQHVVQGGTEFYTVFREGEWVKASLVGMDLYTDIAVLKPEKTPSYADPLPLQTELPQRGQRVLTLGAPNNLRGTVTSGIVSGTERSMRTTQGFGIPDMIQTDAPLNPGNSGGPLITQQGEIVGVNRAREGENIGYAVSSRLAERVALSIIENGRHDNPLVGIRTVEINPSMDNASDVTPTDGIAVVQVMDDSPSSGKLQAANNSSIFTGDIIVKVDDERVQTNEDLSSYLLLETSPRDTVTFTVYRDNKRQTVQVTLGKRDDVPGDS